ncbi:hypothetical protein RFI_02800 [Reticulomyxa filosa]|uniref:riboflavin kinase n=1 Tax=Reticulomyxa filosa TaxID=46433 RepID=X6P849_RETFI|nr:hypothetical protein RFI_02800 [Reticulomyxa filosa]|eukprot:ETO34288.1 hypothetical protein RFI_02800 [Reticulomyxa filosa]
MSRLPDYWKGIEKLKPLRLAGAIVKGYQRGRQIGIPTANLDPQAYANNDEFQKLSEGVYFGWACVDNGPVYKTLLSIGHNPHFKNKNLQLECHLLHKFDDDFYDSKLRVLICAFIRPQYAFDSLGNFFLSSVFSLHILRNEQLIAAINKDIEIGKEALGKSPYEEFQRDNFFKDDEKKDTQSHNAGKL